ncbi:MAG: segregation and condensation protein A [Parcubacteria group bacterium Gr01-1014_56]|nr:MAG: segregation and condensation protein A [Parcubacteria group bacterium Gr01-1014_56]
MAVREAFTVKTPLYEGPLDLLLELIEKRKLLINDISLAAVAEEYITKINALDALPVAETAQFIALAATLLLVKSRSLLPMLELSPDEERDIKELQYRLEVYKIIKEAGRGLSRLFGGAQLYEGSWREPEALFLPDKSATLESLRAAVNMLIEGFPQTLALPRVEVQRTISLEDMVENLSKRVTQAMRLSFKEFAGKKEKTEVIVGFLALLELVKQGIIRASQQKEFGDIMLESDSVSTPSYE